MNKIFTWSGMMALVAGLFLFAGDLLGQEELPAADFQIKKVQNFPDRRVVIFKCDIMAAEGRVFRYPRGTNGKVLKLLAVTDTEVKIQNGDKVELIPRDHSVHLEPEPVERGESFGPRPPLGRPIEMDHPLVTVKPVELATEVLGTNFVAEPKVEGLYWESSGGQTDLKIRLKVEDGVILPQIPHNIFNQLRDDRGTLLATKPKYSTPEFSKDAYISEWKLDQPIASIFNVTVAKQAYAAARRMKLEGVIHFWHGLERQKGALPIFTLAKGTKLQLGTYEFLIAEVKESEIKLITVVPLDLVDQFMIKTEFFDADGKDILYMTPGGGSRGDSRTQLKEVYMIFRFEKPVTQIAMKFETWSKVLTRKVPIMVDVEKKKAAIE